MDYELYIPVKSIYSLDSFEDAFETWLNNNHDFIVLWESVFNREDFELNSDYISTKDLLDLDSISLISKDDEYHIHPHILLAFSMEEPLYKMNMILKIFDLPNDTLIEFINSVFNNEDEDDDEILE